MRSTGDEHEYEMRKATLVVAQYLDLMGATAKHGNARPLHGWGVRGADTVAAVESGRAGGQVTGLAHVPELLRESGLILPDTLGERPWQEPNLPVSRPDFPPDRSRLWPVGTRDQRRRYAELTTDPEIDPRARTAAWNLVSHRHLEGDPPASDRGSDATAERTRASRAIAGPSRPPGPPATSGHDRLAELTDLATGLAADSLAGHLEWAAALLTRTAEAGTSYSIRHLLADRLADLYTHHRHASWWCERMLHPVDRRAVHGPYEAARRVMEQMTEAAETAPDAAEGPGRRRPAGPDRAGRRGHDPDDPGPGQPDPGPSGTDPATGRGPRRRPPGPDAPGSRR